MSVIHKSCQIAYGLMSACPLSLRVIRSLGVCMCVLQALVSDGDLTD